MEPPVVRGWRSVMLDLDAKQSHDLPHSTPALSLDWRSER